MDGGKTVVVTDAFEVPAAGGAHAVEMDPETSVYMAELMESLSRTRPEGKVCGWFHSHPFDANALDETLGKESVRPWAAAAPPLATRKRPGGARHAAPGPHSAVGDGSYSSSSQP